MARPKKLKSRGILTLFGVKSNAGRPKKSYKYSIGGQPVSVSQFKKAQIQKARLYQQISNDEAQRLSARGYSQEQIRQIMLQRLKSEPRLPASMADQELMMRKYLAERTVSPNTQRIIEDIRRIQNKAKIDNIEQQRRHYEKRLVGNKMNLMKAHENMVKTELDFTGVDPETNVLMAQNVFKENPENNILRKRRRNILDTQENSLKFF